MFNKHLSLLLTFFLFLGSITISESAQAKSGRKAHHSKVKKKTHKKHHKASMKIANSKKFKKNAKAHTKVAKKHKLSMKKKKMMAKNFKSVGRKIASIKTKRNKKSKARRSLPREYGTL